MIVRRLQVNPFGGLESAAVEFESGLNVLSGPNEAGKSTLVHALFAAIFLKAGLYKRDFEREIARFIPAAGGDTVRAELEFTVGDKNYLLRKSWGGTAGAELRLPGGTVITDEEGVEEKLAELRPAAEGTFRSVLMTSQGGLGRTLRTLREEHPETVRDLGDILRAAVLETDGVSVDRFRGLLEERYDDYFNHWARLENYPAKGRGIENPWKKEIGLILEAFYVREELRRDLKTVREYEDKLDRVNGRIGELTGRLDNLHRYLEETRPAVDDARRRWVLQAQRGELEVRLENYQEANRQWPVIENELERCEESLNRLTAAEKKLKGLRTEAEEREKKKKAAEIYRRCRKLKEEMEEVRRNRDSLKTVNGDDLRGLKEAAARIERFKGTIAGGRLTVKVTARKEMKLRVSRDLNDVEEYDLKAGGEAELRAGGRIRIESADLTVESASGEEPFAEISRKLRTAESEAGGILERLECRDVEEAESRYRRRRELEGRIAGLEKELNAELEGRSLEELEREAGEEAASGSKTSLPELVEKHERIKGEIRSLGEKQENLSRRLKEYRKRYGEQKTLLLKLAADLGEKEAIEKRIENLAPLPEGVEKVEDFLDEFRKREEETAETESMLNELKIERSGLLASLPEESEESLRARLEEAERNFEVITKEGEALVRVGELSEKLLETMDGDTYAGLREEVEDYIGELTGGRYRKVAMEESLPDGLVRDDGTVLDLRRLSAGTRDDLALALRLALADKFLKGREGFLVMDDPLVDLDPARRQAAAALIQKFASDKQTLVFTCHPEHAELLGGNCIELKEL